MLHTKCGKFTKSEYRTTILTFPLPIPDEEKNSSQVFILTFLYGTSKGFMKTLKAFRKPLRDHKEKWK